MTRELAARSPRADTVAGFAAPTRGRERVHVDHMFQADFGAYLGFLVGMIGSTLQS